MNLALLDTKIIQLINQYSINGELTPFTSATLQDYLLRTRNLVDACQKEIATRKKIPTTVHIFQNPIPNQIAGVQGQAIYQHLSADITFNAYGSKAYAFQVDDPCTVTVEVNGAIRETLTLTDIVPTEHKGLIVALTTDSVVLRFSGLYPYNISNVALYAYVFAAAANIPSFRAYSVYPLPIDCMELCNIKTEQGYAYVTINDYFIESTNLLVNSTISGNLAINYYKYPTTLDVFSDELTELEISPDAQELIPYYVGAHVFLEDNPTISTMLLNEYQTKLNSLLIIASNTQVNVVNGWGW